MYINEKDLNVKEIQSWIKEFMDKVSYCGDYTREMPATDEMANRLAQSIRSKLINKFYDYDKDDLYEDYDW